MKKFLIKLNFQDTQDQSIKGLKGINLRDFLQVLTEIKTYLSYQQLETARRAILAQLSKRTKK